MIGVFVGIVIFYLIFRRQSKKEKHLNSDSLSDEEEEENGVYMNEKNLSVQTDDFK